MNFTLLYHRIINRLIRRFMISSGDSSDRVVYLTFDDGPESEITEFVLDELDRYGFKATFFCRGDNAVNNPELFQLLYDKGHSIGNHTFSHIHSYNKSGKAYAEDVHRCDAILKTKLFRPPHGSLTLSAWMRLRPYYNIYFWSLNSGDSDMDRYDFNRSVNNLKEKTKPGDIVLFHFCHKHEKETKGTLSVYLKWLNDNGYKSDKL